MNKVSVAVLFLSMSTLAGDRYAKALCAGDSSALPTAPPGAPLFSELYLSFINLIKLNTLQRYEGCDATL